MAQEGDVVAGVVDGVQAGQANASPQPLRLDLGCGKNKQPGFVGVDAIGFEGVDVVANLVETVVPMPHPMLRPMQYVAGGFKSWPWSDNSVDEVYCSHFLEHLTGAERVHFFNELHRVMKPGAQARIITPHWSHERAYGDPTHMSAICSWTYFYVSNNWYEINAPHAGYTCDFDYLLAAAHDPNDAWVAFRNQETKSVLMSRNINTVTDLYATLTKK